MVFPSGGPDRGWHLWLLRCLPGVARGTECWSPSLPREHEALVSISTIFFFFLKFTLPVKYLWLELQAAVGIWDRFQILTDYTHTPPLPVSSDILSSLGSWD